MKSNLITKAILFCFFLQFAITTSSCSSDDQSTENASLDAYFEQLKNSTNPFELKNSYEELTNNAIELSPKVIQSNAFTYQWKVIKKNNQELDSIIGTTKEISLVDNKSNTYVIQGTLYYKSELNNQQIDSINQQVNLEFQYRKHITKIFDFLPAYGQFTNKLPQYEPGDTKETMLKKVADAIATDKPSMISLGGFGGYVEFGFDHTIENVPGKPDFQILGNAFWGNNAQGQRGGSSEPGIILVGVDKNGNGKPDPDEWYEIAGSEYNNPKTIHNYEITFFKPSTELDQQAGEIEQYVFYKDNQGNQGYKPKNVFHNQSYFPQWIQEESITFKGTRLPDNSIDESGDGTYWVQYAYEYGYADNAPNSDQASKINIDWAVDKDGNPANLKGIDFIRVYTGINQQAGWLGEVSTEVAGAIDLHL
ncbi:cell surface protein [Myroides sp. LJL119]